MLFAAKHKPLTIKKTFSKSSATDAMLCAEVDRYFSATDGAAAKPYIKLTPNDHFSVTLSYDEICLTGLKPQKEYTFEIHPNIPLGEVKLDKGYRFTKKTIDYDPSIRFKESGYILPAKGEISIPIESTNIDKLSLTLYRINRNNLMEEINNYGLFRTLSTYKLEEIKETDGYQLWSRKLPITSKKNEAVTTAIPVGTLLKKREPGVYILSAKPINDNGEVDQYTISTQWFMVSDIGIFTLEDSQGLHLYTKHLSNATPYKQVKLELVAKNNEVLGSSMATEGVAHFDAALLKGKRGLEPKAIYAYGEAGDFTVLDLSRPAHDLSDRGVAGREVPQHYDAWAYSDRGIFRPSERIPFHLLVRDRNAHAVPHLKLSAKLYDSRGVEISSKLLNTDESGHATGSFGISSAASTGRWKIALFAGAKEPIGSLRFLVEDFVPPKISVTLTQKPEILYPKQPATLKAEARLLTGDTLASAHVEVSTILHAAKNPFPRYQAYQFGDVRQRFANQALGDTESKGGKEGNITIPLTLHATPSTSLPLAAHITLSVSEPGGRPVQRMLDLFYAHRSAYIGIKPLFENHAVDMDSLPRFDLVYLKQARSVPSTLHYRLIQEEVYWNWRSGGDDDWEYYKTYSDHKEIAKGTINTAQNSQLTLERLDWGSYRLEVFDTSGTLSTVRFSSGYEERASKASPDKLPLSTDKQQYHPGETIRLHITPKFTGPLLVMIANHRILERREVMGKEEVPLDLSFEIQDSWGSSLYLLATAFRAQKRELGATRAIGIAHVAVDDPAKRITLTLSHPARIQSNSTLTVTAHATTPLTQESYLTLSAVDKGVLGLTQYQHPDPAAYFYGQQTLGLRIRDVYGELIKAMGAHASFEVGAGDDELAAALLNDSVVANKRQVVALFSQRLRFNAHGSATSTFEIPDFQGTLSLAAVVWNKDAVGSASSELIVKDPLSAELFMPAFISVGDHAQILLRSSFDGSMPQGEYTFKLRSSGGIHVAPTVFSYRKENDQSHTDSRSLTLTAEREGDGNITLDIYHQDRIVASRSWQLGVRATYPKSYVRKMGLLTQQESLTQKVQTEQGQWQHIEKIRLALSGAPLLPAASVAQELMDYSGRCNEQSSSRAFPWLESQDPRYRGLIERAIERVTSRQRLSGGFGLWGSSDPEMWVSAYVIDLLSRAKVHGYAVPQKNIKAGLAWIEQHLGRWSTLATEQEADAYGLYVLARNQRILSSEILHRANDPHSLIRSAQAWGHLAATLAMIGEADKAQHLFEKAERSLGNVSAGFYANYGGVLRDKASLVILLKEAKQDKKAGELFAALALDLKERKWLSTQEMSTLLRADHAIGYREHRLHLEINGKPYQGSKKLIRKAATLETLPQISNSDPEPVWYDLSFVGTPDPATYSHFENHGFSLHKQLYTMQGEPIDLSQIQQHSRIIVVLRGEIRDRSITHPLITDWLGAGFEIENATLTGIDATDGLKWIGKKTATLHSEYRNDRFVSALSRDDNNSFLAAYIIRAVTKGDFTLPPARIEDMYKPRFRAFSSLENTKAQIKSPAEIEAQKIEATPKEPTPKTPKTPQTPQPLSSSDYTKLYTQRVGDLKRYDILELNYLRNGVFAQAGLDFSQSNPALYKRFSVFDWYKPTRSSSSSIYAKLTPLQKENVQKLLAEEKRRCGGLVLADFYRVKIKRLSTSYLKRYTKQELRILRNSLITRYGLTFKDPQLRRIYSQMPWYHPTEITASEILDQKMSDLERANIQTILKVERAK
jgi:uncharacterized protein YfaS (alpha-2-macroglobulin family)